MSDSIEKEKEIEKGNFFKNAVGTVKSSFKGIGSMPTESKILTGGVLLVTGISGFVLGRKSKGNKKSAPHIEQN